jgi:formylglycine-generating enzyme required for sulfatase activity
VEEAIAMKSYTLFLCIVFLVSMADCAPVRVEGNAPSDRIATKTNSIGMKLKLIKAGEFMMGSEKGEKNERPIHKVKITRPFYIGVYEVTQKQYEEVMAKNPSEFKGPNRPVENVTWDDAVLFCKKLSEKEGVKYRLPTEAEWEYACRAGTKTEFYCGDRIDVGYAWYKTNSEAKTHDVGQKKPNAWGLYDMSGNVYEWCSDWFAKDYYISSPEKDPQGPREGQLRVLRGGAWHNTDGNCSSAYRAGLDHDQGSPDSGFRVVRDAE